MLYIFHNLFGDFCDVLLFLNSIYLIKKNSLRIFLQEVSDLYNKDVININDASRSDIESIPGIGKKTAEKIISYRDEHGVIENLDELENIPGIRKNIISKCRKYLIVD